jgi:hypothetical protein
MVGTDCGTTDSLYHTVLHEGYMLGHHTFKILLPSDISGAFWTFRDPSFVIIPANF